MRTADFLRCCLPICLICPAVYDPGGQATAKSYTERPSRSGTRRSPADHFPASPPSDDFHASSRFRVLAVRPATSVGVVAGNEYCSPSLRKFGENPRRSMPPIACWINRTTRPSFGGEGLVARGDHAARELRGESRRKAALSSQACRRAGAIL